jgi:hypothetical protein
MIAGPQGRYGVLVVWAAFAVLGGVAAAQDPDLARELEAPINPRSGASCPTAKQYSVTRPDPPGVPTTVALGLFFQDVSNLSDADQTLNADLYTIIRWRDPRLADPLRGDGSADCPVPGQALWIPAIEPENLRSRQQFYDPHFLVNAKGVATYTRRMLVQVAYPLSFRDFPIDHHRWVFTLWPTLSRSDEVVFHPLERFVGRSDRFSIQGWKAGTTVASVKSDRRPGHSGDYSRFDVALDLSRDWAYYAWKLGLPLTLIVLMAYCVYYIPSSAASQQIGLGMTSMLTLIAYMLSLSSSLPKISYLTRSDRFFVGSAILVFLGLMKGIFTIIWFEHEKRAVPAWIDRAGRWGYPVVMLLNFMNAFFR